MSCKEKLGNIIICCQSPVPFWTNITLSHWLKGLGLHTVSTLLLCLRARGLGLWLRSNQKERLLVEIHMLIACRIRHKERPLFYYKILYYKIISM